VHASPPVYVVDDFLTKSELGKIRALFWAVSYSILDWTLILVTFPFVSKI
jgi:hypothetical protein